MAAFIIFPYLKRLSKAVSQSPFESPSESPLETALRLSTRREHENEPCHCADALRILTRGKGVIFGARFFVLDNWPDRTSVS